MAAARDLESLQLFKPKSAVTIQANHWSSSNLATVDVMSSKYVVFPAMSLIHHPTANKHPTSPLQLISLLRSWKRLSVLYRATESIWGASFWAAGPSFTLAITTA